jgi:hypothetical protein
MTIGWVDGQLGDLFGLQSLVERNAVAIREHCFDRCSQSAKSHRFVVSTSVRHFDGLVVLRPASRPGDLGPCAA